MKKEISFNYKEIEVLFAAKEVTSKKKGSFATSQPIASKYLVSHNPFPFMVYIYTSVEEPKEKQVATILPPKRSQNIGITLVRPIQFFCIL